MLENGRRPRTVFTEDQVKELEKMFNINHYMDLETRKSLSKKIELQEDRIQVIVGLSYLFDKVLGEDCDRRWLLWILVVRIKPNDRRSNIRFRVAVKRERRKKARNGITLVGTCSKEKE